MRKNSTDLPVVNVMFDNAAVDGWNLIGMLQADSRDPTTQNPVTHAGRERAHISARSQLQEESGLLSACVRACVHACERVTCCSRLCTSVLTMSLQLKSSKEGYWLHINCNNQVIKRRNSKRPGESGAKPARDIS